MKNSRFLTYMIFVFLVSISVACGGDSGDAGDPVVGCQDLDNDGAVGATASCPTGQDCDDGNGAIFPGAVEICGDSIDQDCDGSDRACCVDEDNDGVFAAVPECLDGADCNDGDAGISPNAEDICGDGIDQNCDGSDAVCCEPVCEFTDEEGIVITFTCGDDGCDGSCGECPEGANCLDGTCFVGSPDSCEGRCDSYDGQATCQCDSLCFGAGDCCEDICNDGVCNDAPGLAGQCGCDDLDGDGYGEGPNCLGVDCNDADATINPEEEEVCENGKDDDCVDGDAVCEFVECTEETDTDGDGFGTASGCDVKDCDDTSADIFPGQTEICDDDIDQDCDGVDLPCSGVDCVDNDGDGYGEGAECDGADCNDQDPGVNPAAVEACGNDVDDNCDGTVDEDCPAGCVDADGDGHYSTASCEAGDDCDDTNASISPSKAEICGDGVDQDCDPGNEVCDPTACMANAGCPASEWCNTTTGSCFRPTMLEWWAPVVYADTHPDALGWDFFTTLDFDGDDTAGNNGDHIATAPLKGKVYTSKVETATHAYLGYYFYFPMRWSDATFFGTEYENALRGVLLVIRKADDGSYGQLELMLTTNENSILSYGAAGLGFLPLPTGTAKLEDEDGHMRPMVYINSESHAITGNNSWENGFPGGNGVIYRFGYESTVPEDLIQDATYTLVALADSIWADRFEIGPTKLFDEFGHLAGDDSDDRSLAPWGFVDSSATTINPAGEFLYDPATLVDRKHPVGWGTFGTRYESNPYALTVEIWDLGIWDDTDGIGAGDSDVYIKLFLHDGSGAERLVLGESTGVQHHWKQDDVAEGTIINMQLALERHWFYGLHYPGKPYFGIEVRDADLVFDDWLMDPSERSYHSFLGFQVVDWVKSDSAITVTNP